ncbi:MAG: hypothetical protein F4Z82_19095 [Caldilineaceae bacterium SB0668_bin_21]|nr:hypothetical protein [Caldilineaceae bacterium SB0668_bin_21]MYC23507.1 hypothetical protein [Caldilineaceae bacterium SB0662_bin_25]
MSESLEGRIAGDRQPRTAASARLLVLLLIVALSLSACNIRNPFAPRAEPTAAETAGQLEEGSPLFLLVERAKEDLMQTAGADSDEITLVSTEEVEWGDTGLGCPHPDEMYAQMITPGYFIVLQSGGNTYDYHTGADPEGPLVQCTEDGTRAGAAVAQPQELEEEEEETRIDAEDPLPRLIERATEEIIQATGADSDAITVVSTEEVEWSDTSLGCQEPNKMYAQVITPGYKIVLESGGNTYDYHTAADPEGPLVHCTEDGTPASADPALPTQPVGEMLMDDDALTLLIERAKEDLVQATGAAADAISVVSTEEVEWSDSSLGCPDPDTMYAQVITPGFLIVLESEGNTFNYHTATDPEGPLVQCTEDGTPAAMAMVAVAPQMGVEDPLSRLVERATEDLMQAAGAASDEITVLSTEEVEWSDTSLGCPEPDGMYAQMITPGYLIVLETGGDSYKYHTSTDPEGPLVHCTLEAESDE